MGVFDGVAVAVLRPRQLPTGKRVQTYPTADNHQLIDLGSAGAFPAADAYLLPRVWSLHDDPALLRVAFVTTLSPVTDRVRRGTSAVPLAIYAQSALAGEWWVEATCWIAPADVHGLGAVRLASGGRQHLVWDNRDESVCGRVSVRTASSFVTRVNHFRVECRRCLSSVHVAQLQEAQLEGLPALTQLVGRLEAATMACIWPRMAHRDPERLPQILDGMAGALKYRIPGAPEFDRVLQLMRRHAGVASREARAWMVESVRPSVIGAVRHMRIRMVSEPGAFGTSGLRWLQYLPDPDAADLLIEALRTYGPVPSLESAALSLARRAGDAVSEQTDRWRRTHEIAAALGGGR